MLRFLLEDAESAGPGLLLFRGSQLGNRGLADDGPALHAAVVLGRRERVGAPEPGEFGAAVETERLGRSDFERIEPDPEPNPSRALPTVAKGEGDHAVRHAGEDPDGKLERAAGIIETDEVPARKTERFGGLRAYERGVVPGELGEGIGKLLQPPV